MNFPSFIKRRTSRRNTSKLRPKTSDTSLQYDSCEKRLPLTSFLVTTELDVVDADDGLISLREALTAANTNQPFSDAPAGDETGDRIVFRGTFSSTEIVLTEGELTITDDVLIRGPSNATLATEGMRAENSRIFNVDTNEQVRFQFLKLKESTAETGGLININAGSDVVIASSVLNEGSAAQGGAISISSATLRIHDTWFQQNVAQVDSEVTTTQGGAIYAVDSNVTIRSSNFLGNSAGDSGGAISATGGRLQMFSSSLADNRAETGGAVETYQTRVVSDSRFNRNESVFAGGATSFFESEVHLLPGSTFTKNGIFENSSSDLDFAFHSGGAVYSSLGELYVNGAKFSENSSDDGGAILTVGTQAVFQNLRVEDNIANSTGGGIVFSGGRTWVSDSSITNNTANSSTEFDGRGGGIYFAPGNPQTDSILVFRRVTVNGNEAADSGGGIYLSRGAKFRLYGSTVESNVAKGTGGGALVNHSADLVVAGSKLNNNTALGEETGGGALLAIGESNTLVFGSEFSSNTTSGEGGAISMKGGGFTRLANSKLELNGSVLRGGAASVEAGRLVFVGGSVNQNQTNSDAIGVFGKQGGGAIFVDRGAQLYARNGTTFEGNSATTNGGAIQAYGLVNLNEVELRGNNSSQGGAINTGPFSLVFVRDSLFVENSVLNGNGAGILMNSESTLILTDSVFERNVVIDNVRGYALFSNGGFLRTANNTFTANTPNNNPG